MSAPILRPDPEKRPVRRRGPCLAPVRSPLPSSSRVIERQLGIASGAVEVRFDNAVVTLSGGLPITEIAELIHQIWHIEAVVGVVDHLTQS
ncbi:BON domain-containing protein [Kitasatospora sp. NPDC050543]|uniref:BON domain-containing protein n=1 Tax=Kitasatospora sp. NPDC050543 TaxID=3364054 RepID=UPI0037ADC4D7